MVSRWFEIGKIQPRISQQVTPDRFAVILRSWPGTCRCRRWSIPPARGPNDRYGSCRAPVLAGGALAADDHHRSVVTQDVLDHLALRQFDQDHQGHLAPTFWPRQGVDFDDPLGQHRPAWTGATLRFSLRTGGGDSVIVRTFTLYYNSRRKGNGWFTFGHRHQWFSAECLTTLVQL